MCLFFHFHHPHPHYHYHLPHRVHLFFGRPHPRPPMGYGCHPHHPRRPHRY